MMKYTFLFLLSLLFFSNCQLPDPSSDTIITFEASPSWFESLKVELEMKSQELTFIKENNWMYRKTKGKQRLFGELDSTTKAIAEKYSNYDFRITKKLSDTDFKKLYHTIQDILQNSEEDNHKGLDGIAYFITSQSADTIIKKIYHTPTPDSKKINTILNIIKKNFAENIVVQLNIENVERFTTEYKAYKIVSTDPLYVRVLENSSLCDYPDQITSQLPEADTVYVDLINCWNFSDTCIIKPFQEKYEHVEWIVPPAIWFYGKYMHEHEFEVQ